MILYIDFFGKIKMRMGDMALVNAVIGNKLYFGNIYIFQRYFMTAASRSCNSFHRKSSGLLEGLYRAFRVLVGYDSNYRAVIRTVYSSIDS